MTRSTAASSQKLSRRAIVGLIALASLAGPLLFVLVAHYVYHTDGFPLDDAWIYQVYARNLAQTGQWAFVAGQPSTGSTSVLWTLLITPAYLVGLDGRLWTLLLGTLALFSTALASASLFPEDRPAIRLSVGLAVALEWHLIWAAVSGMETVMFAALVMWFWVWLRRRTPELDAHLVRDGMLLGLWGGVLALARPEGIVAFGVGALYAATVTGRWARRFGLAGVTLVGLAILVTPWLLFNKASSGAIWPNTFAAKQAEYAPLLALPYTSRLAEQVLAVWVGPQVVLLPGLIALVIQTARRQPTDWAALLPLAWVTVHLALYAARLPVTYQHARYAIPVIPPLVVLGVRGLANLVRPRASRLAVRVGSLAWATTAAILFPVFLAALGAPAYGRDNQFIQDEMVATANWVRHNVRPDALIAVHDIGALGYFAPHRIVDLAGLVSPDVNGFIDDEGRISEFILAQHADYLIVFPKWPNYDRMVTRPQYCRIWSADQVSGYSPASDLGPMTVYRVSPSDNCASSP